MSRPDTEILGNRVYEGLDMWYTQRESDPQKGPSFEPSLPLSGQAVCGKLQFDHRPGLILSSDQYVGFPKTTVSKDLYRCLMGLVNSD